MKQTLAPVEETTRYPCLSRLIFLSAGSPLSLASLYHSNFSSSHLSTPLSRAGGAPVGLRRWPAAGAPRTRPGRRSTTRTAAAPAVVPLDLGAGAADLGLPERRGGGGDNGGGDGEGWWPRSPEWRSPGSRGAARRQGGARALAHAEQHADGPSRSEQRRPAADLESRSLCAGGVHGGRRRERASSLLVVDVGSGGSPGAFPLLGPSSPTSVGRWRTPRARAVRGLARWRLLGR